MSDVSRDKLIERNRYNERAHAVLSRGTADKLGPEGAAGVPEQLRTPYEIYEQRIAELTQKTSLVLDVCCGNGQHSMIAARCGAKVFVSDIAPSNVALTIRRASLLGLLVEGKVADAEEQPWPDASFDIVTCAGSLSYVDHRKFFRETHRLLRPNGCFVCVDSLNHNPIFRLNRYLHYIRGHRTLSTIKRMPTLSTISLMREIIGPVEMSFHGVFSFLSPILVPIVGPGRCSRFLNWADHSFPSLQRFAFKFVAVARKTREELD